jgi:hypothetical protein
MTDEMAKDERPRRGKSTKTIKARRMLEIECSFTFDKS